MTLRTAATYTTTVVALSTVFVVQTVLNGVVSDALVVAAGIIGVLGAALLADGVGALRGRRGLDPRALTTAAFGGMLAWAGAPLMVMSQRASDAPPGAEVAFFTLSWFGLAVVLWALVAHRPAHWPVTAAAALLAAVGGAVLLASWEFPSSFSPFVRFPARHAYMLVAGVGFAAGSHLIARAGAAVGHRTAFAVSAWAASAPMVFLLVAGIVGSGERIPRNLTALAVLAVVYGLFAWNWTRISTGDPGPRAAVVLFLGPAALTGLSAAERATRILGPDPVGWSVAAAAIAVIIAACLTLWFSASPLRAGQEPEPRRGSRLSLAVGGVLFAGGVASLWLPAVRGEVEGAFGEVYRATWVMPGAEAASGWLVAAAALLAAALVLSLPRRRLTSIVALAAAGSVALVAATYPTVAATPLRTATRWIPADVQQSYGTEYARLAFEAIHQPVRVSVLAGAVVVAAAVAVAAVRVGSRTRSKGTA